MDLPHTEPNVIKVGHINECKIKYVDVVRSQSMPVLFLRETNPSASHQDYRIHWRSLFIHLQTGLQPSP